MRRGLLPGAIIIAGVCSAFSFAIHVRAPIDRVAWLAGCWRLERGETTIDEQWLAPRGGMMMGHSRTVRGTRVVEYETTRIETRDSVLVFIAQPSGQPLAEFRASVTTDSLITFANPQHDFPQRVSYWRVGADSLHARVEGERNGSMRGFDFPMRRVSCEA